MYECAEGFVTKEIHMFYKYFIIAIIIMGVAMYFGGQYAWGVITEQQASIAALKADIDTAKQANEQLSTAIEDARLERDFIQGNMQSVNTKLNEFAEQSQEIDKVLSRHDLTYLASQKPGLIETRVNKGTQSVFDKLEGLAL